MKRRNKERVISEIANHYTEILKLLGEDPTREGLKKTPQRAAKALYDITIGYEEDPREIVSQAIFENCGSQIVTVKDLEFYSMCEHHILPFFGKISIAYIPDEKIIGLSKIARLVNSFSKRLQIQERLTQEVCDALTDYFPNKGVLVVCRAEHLCMKMRGVEKQEGTTLTMAYNGLFKEDNELKKEALALLKE